MVRIHVGEGLNLKTFEAYKGVLSHYSGYFDKAFNGEFQEAAQGAVNLPSEDPKVFEIFLYWTCSQRFTTDGNAAKALAWELLCALWIFGDAHSVPLFQNEVANLFQMKVLTEWMVPSTCINLAYKNTMPGSSLRKLFAHLVGRLASADAANMNLQGWPQEALVDLTSLVWRRGFKGYETKELLARWNMCEFHVHEAGVKFERDEKPVPQAK